MQATSTSVEASANGRNPRSNDEPIEAKIKPKHGTSTALSCCARSTRDSGVHWQRETR